MCWSYAWSVGRRLKRAPPFQALDYLLIGRLREICIELRHAEEGLWRVHTHELVGVACKTIGQITWRHGYSENDAGRATRPGYLTRGSGSRPGSYSVIDYNDSRTVDRHRNSTTPVAPGSSLQLDPLPLLHRSHVFRRDARHPDDLTIEDPNVILPDGTHTQLRLEGHPELADHDDVEWRIQRRSDFRRDRYPSPREA